MSETFAQLLDELNQVAPTPSQDVDVDLYYADTTLTEEELAQLRTAFEARLAVQQ